MEDPHAGRETRITDSSNQSAPVSSEEAPLINQSTLTMVNDRTSTVAKATEVPTNHNTSQVTTNYRKDIPEFLGSFIQVAEGLIDASTPQSVFQTIDLPEVFLADPMVKAKITGFSGLRGTFRVTLICNGNEMQQGIIMMNFVPQGQVPGMCSATRLDHTVTRSMLPCALLDINCDSMAEFIIPYCSPYEYSDLINGTGKWGRITLSMYAPFRVGTGTTSAPWTLYVSMLPETIELLNPTVYAPADPLPGQRVNMKSSTKSRVSKPDKELAAVPDKGMISSILRSGGHLASTVGFAVPSLAPIAVPVSWAMNLASGVASAFGYSKPRNSAGSNPVVLKTSSNMQNADAIDDVESLGVLNAAETESMSNFSGRDEDETALDFILTKSCNIQLDTWNTSQGSAVRIWSRVLRPSSFETTVLGPPIVKRGHPVCYLANMFAYYHGSFRFIFRLSKTPLHQGRLMFVFYPRLGTDPGMGSSYYAHRDFIDISKGSIFKFDVPYTYNQTYLPTNASYGMVCLYILQELTAPSTVSSTIDIISEVACCPGFDFAAPLADCGNVEPYITSYSAYKTNSGTNSPCKINEVKLVGNASGSTPSLSNAARCIGERIVSLRQLMQTSTAPAYPPATIGYKIAVRPFTIGASNTDNILERGAMGGDYYSLFASMYAYSRGGMTLRASWQSATSIGKMRAFVENSPTGVDLPIKTWGEEPQLSRSPGFYPSNNLMSVYCPQYTPLHMRLNRISTISIDGTGGTQEPNDALTFRGCVVFTQFSVTGDRIDLLRQCSDDLQLGMFLGPLPWTFLTTVPAEQNPPLISSLSLREVAPARLPSRGSDLNYPPPSPYSPLSHGLNTGHALNGHPTRKEGGNAERASDHPHASDPVVESGTRSSSLVRQTRGQKDV